MTEYKFMFEEVKQMILYSYSNYIFILGHPVDTTVRKYAKYFEFFDKGEDQCFICGKKIDHFKLIKTNGAGSIHKPTGLIKYTLKPYTEDNIPITIDHWYPKSFLKHYKLKTNFDNHIVMCRDCNKEKENIIPLAGWYKSKFRIPELRYCGKVPVLPLFNIAQLPTSIIR